MKTLWILDGLLVPPPSALLLYDLYDMDFSRQLLVESMRAGVAIENFACEDCTRELEMLTGRALPAEPTRDLIVRPGDAVFGFLKNHHDEGIVEEYAEKCEELPDFLFAFSIDATDAAQMARVLKMAHESCDKHLDQFLVQLSAFVLHEQWREDAHGNGNGKGKGKGKKGRVT